MVANQVRGNNDADELFDKLGIVVNKFLNIDIEYLGSVPYDANMQRAVMRQEPLSMAAPNAAAARSVEKIARVLANKEEEPSRAFGIMQLFSSVIRMKFTR